MNYANPNPFAVAGQAEQRAKLGDFNKIIECVMRGGGDMLETLEYAKNTRANDRVQTVLKATIDAISTSVGSGRPVAEWSGTVAAVFQSLTKFGAFDVMYEAAMRAVLLRSRIAVVTNSVTGSAPGEMQVSPINNFTLSGMALEAYKTFVAVIVTNEALKIGDPLVSALISAELRNGISIATDQKFIELITTGISPISSSGATAVNILTDIDAAAATLSVDNTSQLFLIVSPAVALKWSLKTSADGMAAFPQMTPVGGFIGGIRVVTSGGLAANTLVLCDAHQIAASSGNIEISASDQAALEFATSPSSPPVAGQLIQSLWQQNMTGLRALRYFSAQRLRDTSVAVVGSLNYTGNSPA